MLLRSLASLIFLGPFLSGCASQARLTIHSDPSGAQISEDGRGVQTGVAPIVVAYNKSVLKQHRDSSGCYLVNGFLARWPSGSVGKSGSPIRLCGSPTANYEITIRNPGPSAEEDLDNARRVEDERRRQQEAAEVEQRRREAEAEELGRAIAQVALIPVANNLAPKAQRTQIMQQLKVDAVNSSTRYVGEKIGNPELTQPLIQAALIPVANNLGPKEQRPALVQQLGTSAAAGAVLFLDRDGLLNALKGPTPEDALLGAQVQDARILQSVRESSRRQAALRVNTIITRLLPELHHKSGDFIVRVIESDEVNAYTTGGRYIYVYKALLDEVADDDELAGILGHELAHIDAGHIPRSAQQAGWAGLGALVGYLKDRNPGKGFQAARNTFSRVHESEADVLGAVYAQRAGFNPRGLANFFDRQAITHARVSHNPWLLDHPFDQERRTRVLDVAQARASGTRASDPIAAKVLETLREAESR